MDHSFCGVAVPERNMAFLPGCFGQNPFNGLFKIFQFAQSIGAPGDGNRALGVGPQGYAGNAQIGSFFLNAARIRQRKAAIENQVHESDVVQRLKEQEIFRFFQFGQDPDFGGVFSSSGMQGQNQRNLF